MKKILFFCCVLTIWACDNETKTPLPEVVETPVSNNIQSIEDPGDKKPIPGSPITQKELDDLKPKMNMPAPDYILKGVNFQPEFNKTMIAKGKRIFTKKKCVECHSLTAEGGTASSFVNMFDRHEPVWVMNATRNVDVEVGKKMKNCPVRSEEGKLTLIQSRDLLELVRSLSE